MKKTMMIDDSKINNAILRNNNPAAHKIHITLEKARQLNGLDIDDVALLLNISNEDHLEELFDTAKYVKNEIYGKRLVLFAPLYISNYCSNNCLYCGFRSPNKDISRKTLSQEDIKNETLQILKQGHKRILMLMGENHSQCDLDYFISAIESVYSVKDDKGSSIRRVNLEIAPLTDNEFIKLSQVQIGTYTVFQETYHRETYQKVHLSGKKADFDWRISTMDRALSNGMHDVGIGALFGLYDYKFEVISLIEHSKHLEAAFGIGPHTISIPRLRPASNAPASLTDEFRVSDKNFMKLVAILRCAVPYTGIILSTREPINVRTSLFDLGVSQISAGSRTSPGGYKQAFSLDNSQGQFELNDCRSSGEVIRDVIERGFIPSFCTACYRLGRVGGDFMDLAKPGLIKSHCHPNGLTTLKEYLEDYADEETKIIGNELIKSELQNIPKQQSLVKTCEYLARIELGERDLYF